MATGRNQACVFQIGVLLTFLGFRGAPFQESYDHRQPTGALLEQHRQYALNPPAKTS